MPKTGAQCGIPPVKVSCGDCCCTFSIDGIPDDATGAIDPAVIAAAIAAITQLILAILANRKPKPAPATG